MKKTKIAINGFGRIGRLFFKQVLKNPNIEIVAINDLGDIDNLAYLLKYDTVYGRYDKEVKITDGSISVAGQKIKYLQIKDPAQLPWKDLAVDIVIESTGVFESYEKAKVHLDAGAKRVVITAPAKDADNPNGQTVLIGVNEEAFQTCRITSNGSCTTNAASPIIQIMHETVGIEKAVLNTVHGYTATQNIVDGPTKGKDFRRGRAAAQNITPSTTGAAAAVTRAIKELSGKFDGMAMRVPVPAGSIADITFLSKKNTTAEEVNKILKKAASEPRWNKVLKVSDDLLVSSDILGEPYGAIVDLNFTKVVDGNLVKILSWYDNEAGYVKTLVEHVLKAAETI
ncbi:type I glyceraldehyde-3-phosphate dehydrogenase [Candidatus Nomurabacteria bacterium RIFCSPLOWO2_01_FULL_42_20]|uniref:Type I glyceraldehyde-3-phosphate dehydrogenase n=1 Tax=Candidatus Nomurabacteria bacterium RIFCSPHIGHO2_01_FULL_42_16 TaxID=1801743 RepID=A0A1F6VHV9_9BACT|nr:MAG: type I glyceraldehyde-3-phosphate dehydrogenase [Candidatus Nomurabacteria bacterium RIFCSPHIGHO2_01_FULL_42_16]OGI92109.1 MAG: type I glyceraldehyde-3-phosphate dehydrogenase [Candidatus Nomurabacteria bacterium RIFCSPLOWO2_01_FULL_42_20]